MLCMISYVQTYYKLKVTCYASFQDVKATCRGTYWGTVDDLCQENIDRVRWVISLNATNKLITYQQTRRFCNLHFGICRN